MGTSSTSLFKESGKLGYNHVKGTFSALVLFNAIFKKYNNATLETALSLTVAFIHARGMKSIWTYVVTKYAYWSFYLDDSLHCGV